MCIKKSTKSRKWSWRGQDNSEAYTKDYAIKMLSILWHEMNHIKQSGIIPNLCCSLTMKKLYYVNLDRLSHSKPR